MAELTTGTYSVALTAVRPPSSSRFWAIPIIGILVKTIILIPHFIILYVLGIVVNVAQLVIWVPVLFMGGYPDWAYSLVAGYLRWAARVAIYFLGVSDTYPPFSMDAPGDVFIAKPASSNQAFAIPIFGLLARLILLIPHFVVLFGIFYAIYICQLVIWIPVLFAGRYPGWAFALSAGLVQWYVRVYAYVYGLTDTYPPFPLI